MSLPADCSLLMLTRNCARFLPMSLSFAGLEFKEFIALDAGSTDETLEILRGFNAKIIHSEETEDFAALRNQLQDAATYDWVFHLDADELIDASLLSNLSVWLAPYSQIRLKDTVAFKIPRFNAYADKYPDYQIRLLNRRFVCWERPIHEIAVLRSTRKPVDEPVMVGTEKVNYSQTLDGHPIIHLSYFGESQRSRWQRLEERYRINPP